MLRGVRCHHGAVLVCISPIVSDVEHLSTCSVASRMPSLDKGPFRSLAHFSNGIFFFKLSCMSCLHVLEINSLFLNSVPNIFFPHSKGFFFSLVYGFPFSAKAFEVGDSSVEFCLIFHYSKSR